MNFVAVLICVLSALFTQAAFAADTLSIAVASEGRTPSSHVSSVEARCPYFLMFDSKGRFVEAVANPRKRTAKGAAALAVDLVSRKGATVLIASALGNEMVVALRTRGIRYQQYQGSAADAVNKFLCNELPLCPL